MCCAKPWCERYVSAHQSALSGTTPHRNVWNSTQQGLAHPCLLSMVSVFVILPLHWLRGRDGQTVIEESRGVTEVTFHLKALLFILNANTSCVYFQDSFSPSMAFLIITKEQFTKNSCWHQTWPFSFFFPPSIWVYILPSPDSMTSVLDHFSIATTCCDFRKCFN